MVQIKHFTAPQKLPNFQFSRRANWTWGDKILVSPPPPPARPENHCESKQTYFIVSKKPFTCQSSRQNYSSREIEWVVFTKTAS